MNIGIASPTPIVQESEQSKQNKAKAYHTQALDAELNRSTSTLVQSESWYYIEKENLFVELGHNNFADYIYHEFGKSEITAKKYTQVYRVFCVELGKNIQELAAIGAGKLCRICAHVNIDNVDQILRDLPNLTQQEIAQMIKEKKPIQPSLEEQNDKCWLKVKGPREMVEVVESAIDFAKGELENFTEVLDSRGVPDLMALNHISAIYMASVDLDGNPVNTLQNSISALESAYNVKINYEDNTDVS